MTADERPCACGSSWPATRDADGGWRCYHCYDTWQAERETRIVDAKEMLKALFAERPIDSAAARDAALWLAALRGEPGAARAYGRHLRTARALQRNSAVRDAAAQASALHAYRDAQRDAYRAVRRAAKRAGTPLPTGRATQSINRRARRGAP